MHRLLTLITALVLFSSMPAFAQNATIEAAAKALGAPSVKTLEISGSGFTYAIGQSLTPGQGWPKFNMRDYVRTINYDTASSREVLLRSRADAKGGGLPGVGEVRQQVFVSGDHAWNAV